MKEIVIRQTYTNATFVILGCIIFTTIGYFVGGFYGFLGILFFGGGGALYALILLGKGRMIIKLTDKGVRDWNGNLIPWNNIKEVGITRLPVRFSGKVLGILLKDPSKYLKSMKGGQITEILMDYNLNSMGYHLAFPGGFDKSLEEIASLMKKHIKS